jgi:PAS domain S-box-containing protein
VAFCIDISERARANAALRASEQRYRDLADAMPLVVWIARPNGELDYFNQRWFDYTGMTLGQTQGWGWQPVLHPDDLQNCLERWAEAVRTGQPFEIEYRWQRADGIYRWHLGRALAVRDADGQIAYWVGTGTDIEEQKQAEDQQRLLAEASVLLVSSLDYQPMLTQLTRLIVPRLADWCAIHILEDDVIRRLAFTHSDPAKQALVSERPERYPVDPHVRHIVSQVLRSGEPELYSDVPDTLLVEAARDDQHLQTLRTLDVRSYMCLPMVARGHTLGTITLAIADSGRRYGQAELALGEDLASRAAIALDNARLYHDAEAARRRLAFLAQASELLSSSLEYESRLKNLADLAVPYLADWCIIDMVQEDGSVERLKIAIADQSKEPLAHQLQLRHPVLKPDDHHTILNVLRTGRSWIDPKVSDARLVGEGRDPEHVEILRKLGFKSEMVVPLVARERVLGTITFVYGASGSSYGPAELALAEDLARRAAAAVDNARLYRDAQAAVRARDQFLSIASHELKTPLTSLMGYVDLMQRRAARAGDQVERDQRAMRVVGEQAARLNKLVGALLDLSRIETGQLSIERGLVDLNAMARRLVEEAQPTTDRHTIRFSGADQPIMLLGDELRLEQVVQNLIQNAIKYSPSGGTVTVQVERQAANAYVRVSDQGIGIPAAALPQLFRRFYRASNADSQHISGMGIGLYVVKEIVELHGGAVEVASRESQGSTFTISLPLLDVDE